MVLLNRSYIHLLETNIWIYIESNQWIATETITYVNFPKRNLFPAIHKVYSCKSRNLYIEKAKLNKGIFSIYDLRISI